MPIPNAFADDHRIRALAETLRMTADQVNAAFAAYLPRDTVEAAMVEQILLLEYNLHLATRAASNPGLTPALADRLRRTVCAIERQLNRASVRLEKRQSQFRGELPQQYWRDTPIEAVGPYDETAIQAPEPVAAEPTTPPEPARFPKPVSESARPFTLDDPRADGDALCHLARMRLTGDEDPDLIWASAARDANHAASRRSHRRAA